MAYGIGPISGCHINPAVTAAMFTAGRIDTTQAIGYMISQVIGAVVGALILVVILTGKPGGYDIAALGLGQNGYEAQSPGGYSMLAAVVTELFATFIFAVVILGLIIGLTLLALHMPFFQVTGLSVNPARSIGPAAFVGGTALAQVWLFIAMPLLGGAIAGYLFRGRVLSAD
jgi:aquaporin Z